ncbi:membrane protein FAM174B [Mustelus asterias]
MCCWGLCVLAALLLPLAEAERQLLPERSRLQAPLNLSSSTAAAPPSNGTATALDRVEFLLQHLATLKNLVLVVCVGAFLLIVCLLIRVIRSGRKIKKTRKYDIITTPAEKVEMTPLNEEDDDDEDATVFDVKYSR